MTRTLLLLIMLLFAAPSFAQTKQSAPVANQQQLDSIRLVIENDLDADFNVKKENLEYKMSTVDWWLTVMGVLLMVLTVFGLLYGIKVISDIERQRKNFVKDQKKWLKSHKRKLESMGNKLLSAKESELDSRIGEIQEATRKSFEELKTTLIGEVKTELMTIVAEARESLKKIKEQERISKELNIGSKVYHLEAMNSNNKDSDSDVTFNFKQQADSISESKYATPFQKDMAKALKLYYAKDYKECIKKHQEILDNYEKDDLTPDLLAEIYYRMAYAYVEYDNVKAIEFFRKALEYNPFNYNSMYNLGCIYNILGDYNTAIKMFYNAIELKPDFSDAWNNLGISFFEKKDYKTAIAKYNEAIRLKPNNAEAWNNLGNTYYNIGEYNKAIEKLNKAIEFKPILDAAWNNLGNAYLAKCKYNTAIEMYSKAIELNPDYADALINRGASYTAKGESENARADYEEALRLKPDDASPLANYSELQIVFNEDASENLTKLEGAAKTEKGIFNYYLLNTIYNKKHGNYHGTAEDAFNQLTQTVGGDASKVKWNFDILNKWIDPDDTTLPTPEQGVIDFVKELITRIEDWRNTKPE